MKKQVAIKLIIVISILLMLVIGASYAYFAMVKTTVNVSIGNLNTITFSISGENNLNMTINPFLPTNENFISVSDKYNTTVYLANNSGVTTTCSYEIMFEVYDPSDDIVPSPDNTDEVPELVIRGNEESGQNSKFEYDLKHKPYNSLSSNVYKITDGAITVPDGGTLSQVWQIDIAYYNLDFNQVINANKKINGRIFFNSKGCKEGSTAKLIINGLTGSSYTNSNNQPWTVKNENGIRYEGKDPDNYICFKDSCDNSDVYRIVGVMLGDEAKDGDTYYASNTLKIVKKTGYGSSRAFGPDGNWLNSTVRTNLNSDFLADASISNIAGKILTNKWYLLTMSSSNSTAATYFNSERNGTKINADRPDYSYDKVGLLYGSDYMYGSYESGSCKHSSAYSTNYPGYCRNYNYLVTGSNYWTISPSLSYAARERYVANNGETTTIATSSKYAIYPTFYLLSNIMLKGSGTLEDPYKLI